MIKTFAAHSFTGAAQLPARSGRRETEELLAHTHRRKVLAGLLRFDTSKSGDTRASLAEVVARMPPSQKDIYFIAAENKEAAQSSPFVERLGKKDLEVCLRPPVSSLLCQCSSAPSWERVGSVRCVEHRAPNTSQSGSCLENSLGSCLGNKSVLLKSLPSLLFPKAAEETAFLHLNHACSLVQVLYLTEPIDEPTVSALADFEGRKFVDVSREGLDLGDEDDKKRVCAPQMRSPASSICLPTALTPLDI